MKASQVLPHHGLGQLHRPAVGQTRLVIRIGRGTAAKLVGKKLERCLERMKLSLLLYLDVVMPDRADEINSRKHEEDKEEQADK